MKFISFTFIITGFSLLAACSVGPNYARPSAEVPAAYKELAGWKRAQPQDHIPRGKWWAIFGDPVLNSLEEQVNISNQSIAQAEAQFRQARALVGVARAGYFPTITGGASATRSGSGAGGPVSGATGTVAGAGGGAGLTGSTVTDYSLTFDAVWELDLWGRVRRSVESNQASAQASEAEVEAMRLSIQATLAQDYFQLRVLDAQKQLLNQTVAAFEKSLELTRNRYASGVASRADVLQAETQLKTTQAQAIDLEVLRAQLEHAISVLLGKPPSAFSIIAQPLAAVAPAIPVGVPSELLERRPDIASAERRVAAANAQIGVAMAAYYPTLRLAASGGFENTDLSRLLIWPSRFWSVGPSLSEILFSGGLRRAQTDQARAAYDASVAAYRQTVLTGFQEVEDNLAALRILDQEAQVQEEAIKAARQSVTVTTNQYKAGVVSYLNVIVTQAAALANERTGVDILGRRLGATVLLIKALGGGWHTPALSTQDPSRNAASTVNGGPKQGSEQSPGRTGEARKQ